MAITLAFVGLRLVTNPLVGLGVDESYTVAISRQLSLSYFDHPPLHQWMVWAAMKAGASGRWLRAPFILLSGVTSWLMFLLTRRLFGAAAGVWSTLAFNLCGFFTVAAGAWILPDGPLNLCLLASALVLASILFPAAGQTEADRWWAWLTFGLFVGLAALSKYQAVFFGLGVLVYILTCPRRWREMLNPKPVAAAFIALAVASPVIIWNAQNGWVSFLFQGARGGVHHGPQPLWVLVAILGQAALALPWIYGPLVIASAKAAWAGPAAERRWLCLTLGAPAIVVFTLTPLWGEHALPHWSMPGWLMMFPLLGAWLADIGRDRTWPRAWAWASIAATLGVWALAASETDTGWISVAFPSVRRDPTIETVSWNGLRPIVLQAKATNPRCLFVGALNWRDGGKIGAAVGDVAPVRVLSSDPRGFSFLTTPRSLEGCDALIIGSPQTVRAATGALKTRFSALEPWGDEQEGREGRREISLSLVMGRRLMAPLASAYATPVRRSP